MLPGTIEGMKHVCYFRHALALDERRVKFLPEYTYGGTAMGPTKSEDKKPSPINHESRTITIIPFRGRGCSDHQRRTSDHDDRPPADNEGVNAHSPSRIKSRKIALKQEKYGLQERTQICKWVHFSARGIALVIF
jgi:hypothetical protein